MLHEPTTSITDFILGLEALILAALLAVNGHPFPSLPYWITILVLFGLAALLGGFAHGLARPSMFAFIYLCLSILLASSILATVTDFFGHGVTLRARWPAALLALIFFLVARRYPTRIPAYATLQAVVLLLALILYLRLAFTRALPGAGYIAAGIAITLAAATLLLKKVQFTVVWTFDRNGVYHLALMVAVLFYYLGLSLRASGTY